SQSCQNCDEGCAAAVGVCEAVVASDPVTVRFVAVAGAVATAGLSARCTVTGAVALPSTRLKVPLLFTMNVAPVVGAGRVTVTPGNAVMVTVPSEAASVKVRIRHWFPSFRPDQLGPVTPSAGMARFIGWPCVRKSP